MTDRELLKFAENDLGLANKGSITTEQAQTAATRAVAACLIVIARNIARKGGLNV